MDNFEEIQYSILEMLNEMKLLINSTRLSDKKKLELLKQYVDEQCDVIKKDIAINKKVEKIELVFKVLSNH